MRPNFRGVGASDGEYGHGEGEVADMQAVLRFVRERYPDLPLVLAGFSFGAVVQSRVSETVHPKHLLLVGPAVNLFQIGHSTRQHPGDPWRMRRAGTDCASARLGQQHSGVTFAVVRDADHFFHKKLSELKQHILELCPC